MHLLAFSLLLFSPAILSLYAHPLFTFLYAHNTMYVPIKRSCAALESLACTLHKHTYNTMQDCSSTVCQTHRTASAVDALHWGPQRAPLPGQDQA